MPYVNIPNSELGPLVGKLVGRIKGRVRTEVETKVEEFLEEFKTNAICSNEVKLNNIITTKDRINTTLLGFKNRIEKIRKITDPLLAATTSFRLIINLLKILPTPTTPAVTTGTIISLSDKLELAKEFVTQIEEDVTTINNLILGTTGIFLIIENIISNLDIIEFEVRKCRGEVSEKEILDNLVKSKDTLTDPLINENLSFTNSNGKEYKLEIKTESLDGIAPLRFAIAREVNSGRIVLTGEKSYSSSTSILINELKFRIETELI